ncbi:MAG: AAA family ATPase [Cyanobacteria bacterium J06621_8]
MEKIEIKNFLGIKDITVEVKQINIFIGPQASGKSVIAKLLYYFKDFLSEIIFAAAEEDNQSDLDQKCQQKFLKFFPSSAWGNDSFQIRYSFHQQYIEIKRTNGARKKSVKVILKYSKAYQDFFNALVKLRQDFPDKNTREYLPFNLISKLNSKLSAKKTLLTLMSQLPGNQSNIGYFNQLYIPAGRSFFSNLKNSIFTFLSDNTTIDPFLIQFGTYYENSKKIAVEQINNEHGKLLPEITFLTSKILCGEYLQINGDDYIVNDNRTINLANSSSGQQETLPLSIILKNIALEESEEGGNSIYIEEPEAHIFPTAQKSIVELIATVYNAQKDRAQFFITTHSPYILTAFNNLLQAGILAVDATEEKLKKINKLVPESRLLNSDEVAVYSLENGYCQSIMDQETGLIDASMIDEVSNELAVQFDQLLELEE